jgi:methyl-accepting chemotaxis protein
MFFQTTDEQNEAAKQAVKATDFSALSAELDKTLKRMTDLKEGASGLFDMFEDLIIQSEELNKTFVGGRLRIQEMQKAINDAAPDVVRLGGTYEDVSKTISEIAAGTRTQIVASTKDVRELFAAGEIIGTSVLKIVDAFDKVGISYDNIAENLADSISYVQGIGQNAKVVM